MRPTSRDNLYDVAENLNLGNRWDLGNGLSIDCLHDKQLHSVENVDVETELENGSVDRGIGNIDADRI